MELWTSALSCWKCHWPDLKSAGLFPRNLCWTPLKPQHSNPNPNRLVNQLWCIDFLTPPTPLIIPHRLPGFLESLIIFTNPSSRAGYDTRSIFKAEFNRFEFRVFCLLDLLPYQGWRTQSALLFTHSWRENNWIHTFPKGIILVPCEMQSVSSRIWTRVAVSNSCDDNYYTTGTSLNLLCHSKTHARFMQDGRKAVWSIPYVVSVAFFPSLKHNCIAYRSSKVSTRPDYIFELPQLWQSGLSRVYSNCCCSCSFKPEIIEIGPLSHKMYSNIIEHFQESTTILNACTKKSGNLLKTPCTWALLFGLVMQRYKVYIFNIIIIIIKSLCRWGFSRLILSLSLCLSLSLSPSVPILHRSRQFFQTTSWVCTELM